MLFVYRYRFFTRITGIGRFTMIEVSHLRCFVAVAEELHFGRAAARLNMTQPPLSRQIQLLERSLGCELFLRTSRSVLLTEAGVSFRPEAERILRLLENATNTTRSVASGRSGTLRCGFTAATAYRFLPELIRAVKTQIPEASLDLHEMVSGRQIGALDTGEIDLGLMRPPIDQALFNSRLVAREELLLAVPVGHALAQKPLADWTDLNGVDFIMYDSHHAKYFYNLVVTCLASEQVAPNVVQRLTQIHSILSLVRAGVGVAVVPASAKVLGTADVAYRRFSDERFAYAELCAVWREANHNPLAPLVVEIAEHLVADGSQIDQR